MKKGRVNERNIGNYSLNSELKNRIKKTDSISKEELQFAKQILSKVYDSLQFDKDLSDCGHLSENAIFTDGGRFIISMNREAFENLYELINKL